MSILVPRTRTLGVRLSTDEYAALERFCLESGARSISDMARAAICNFIQRPDPGSVIATMLNQNVAQVKDLEQRIDTLTVEIQLLKAPIGGLSTKVNRHDCGSEENLLANTPTYDPGL